MRVFFVWKFRAQIFCTYILGLSFFGPTILAKKLPKNVGKIDI